MTEMELALSCIALSFALSAAPFLDYGDLSLSSHIVFVPMCLIVFSSVVTALVAITVVLHRLIVRKARMVRHPLVLGTLMIICAVAALAVFRPSAATESWLGASSVYGVALEIFYILAFCLSPLLAAIVIAVLVVPVWAVVRVAICLAARDGWNAAWFASIPLLCVCLFLAGRSLGNRVVIHYVGPIIQSAIRDAANGKRLPAPSQESPIFVALGPPVRAYYVLGGMLFAATYIVYDPADSKNPNAVAHISKLLDGGRCEVRASPIGGGYFLANDGC